MIRSARAKCKLHAVAAGRGVKAAGVAQKGGRPRPFLEEWLLARIHHVGRQFPGRLANAVSYLCPAHRNTLDLAAVPAVRPYLDCPSHRCLAHGTAKKHMVTRWRGGVAVGADGLMIEVHLCRRKALSMVRRALHAHAQNSSKWRTKCARPWSDQLIRHALFTRAAVDGEGLQLVTRSTIKCESTQTVRSLLASG